MFSNTAYEALYQHIGLGLHSKFIELITGETFFKGLVLMIFGVMFFFTLLKFISRYIPGSLIEKRHVPISKFIKIIACLFLGLAILRVGTDAQVMDYQGKNWAENSYVQKQVSHVQTEYQVSVVFELMSRTAHEVSSLLSRVIDGIFAKGNSQLQAPNFFYKAIMYGGLGTIRDQGLREKLQFYTEECFTKVLPNMEADASQGSIDRFFKPSQEADDELQRIDLELGNGKKTTCYEVKEEVRQDFVDYTSNEVGGLPQSLKEKAFGNLFDSRTYYNYTASKYLVNYFYDAHEGRLGIQKNAEVPSTAGKTFQILGRFFGWDGILGGVGLRDLQGASEAATRSQEFSEHLARAPHVAGFIQMLLIAVFPWLIFFVVAGKWRVLVVWFWIYFSVLLWAPLWTLLYHIMLGISMSAEVMKAFGDLSDGISLYSAQLVNHRLYYMFSIYSWVQLLVATLTTGSVFMFLKPMLGESETESKPEFLETTSGPLMTAAKAAL